MTKKSNEIIELNIIIRDRLDYGRNVDLKCTQEPFIDRLREATMWTQEPYEDRN
jgi:hypothetical protein